MTNLKKIFTPKVSSSNTVKSYRERSFLSFLVARTKVSKSLLRKLTISVVIFSLYIGLGAPVFGQAKNTQPNQEAQESERSDTNTDADASTEIASDLDADICVDADGPHTDPKRTPDMTKLELNEDKDVWLSQVDLGNVHLSGFVAPVRGLLAVPTEVKEPLPLLIFSHLRAPNCQDQTFAIPCPQGEALRFDLGMAYLGEALAREGYAVLIPDLTPVWIGKDTDQPYDQRKMWSLIVDDLLKALESDSNGETDFFQADLGPGLDRSKEDTNSLDLETELEAKIDFNRIGLMVHSRSALIIDTAADLFGEDRLMSIFAYGASYNAIAADEVDPPAVDLPLLYINGDDDGDVGYQVNLWLGEHIQEVRKNPLISVQVPGFGHMFINRELQSPEQDDRRAADIVELPSAEDHEKLLIEAATEWFNLTIKDDQESDEHKASKLPFGATDDLPEEFAGYKVRWLLASPGEKTVHIPASAFKDSQESIDPKADNKELAASDKNKDSTAAKGKLGFHADPMNPLANKDAEKILPAPNIGVIVSISELYHFTEASIDTEFPAGTKSIALHLLPSGTPAEGETVSLTMTIELEDGSTWSNTWEDSEPALSNQASEISNGVYTLATIRSQVDSNVTENKITRIMLESSGLPIEIRGLDLVY